MHGPTVEELVERMRAAREREQAAGGPAVRPAPAQEPGAALGGPEPQAPLAAEGSMKPWSTAGVRAELERRGWTLIYSKTLGEPVLWLRDSNVVVPGRWRKHVAYTLAELAALRGVTPDGMREIHAAKKVFGGTVLPPEKARRVRAAVEGKGAESVESHLGS